MLNFSQRDLDRAYDRENLYDQKFGPVQDLQDPVEAEYDVAHEAVMEFPKESRPYCAVCKLEEQICKRTST